MAIPTLSRHDFTILGILFWLENKSAHDPVTLSLR
jgi:hypothetical protein